MPLEMEETPLSASNHLGVPSGLHLGSGPMSAVPFVQIFSRSLLPGSLGSTRQTFVTLSFRFKAGNSQPTHYIMMLALFLDGVSGWRRDGQRWGNETDRRSGDQETGMSSLRLL